jgi:predicted enzyme related to lactoylglutathione lyase
MEHPIMWFEILGDDAGRLQSFYGELFGWKIDANNPMRYGMVETGSKEGIPGGIGAREGALSHHVTVYVRTRDLDESLERAKRLGGKVVMPVTKLPDVTIALFSDPEGNVIGLLQG